MMSGPLLFQRPSSQGSPWSRFCQPATESNNTFTQFYLKDVGLANSELFHLGPVVAA